MREGEGNHTSRKKKEQEVKTPDMTQEGGRQNKTGNDRTNTKHYGLGAILTALSGNVYSCLSLLLQMDEPLCICLIKRSLQTYFCRTGFLFSSVLLVEHCHNTL